MPDVLMDLSIFLPKWMVCLDFATSTCEIRQILVIQELGRLVYHDDILEGGLFIRHELVQIDFLMLIVSQILHPLMLWHHCQACKATRDQISRARM